MPGIINKIKIHKKSIVLLGMEVLLIICLIICGLCMCAALLILTALLNRAVIRKMNRQAAPFYVKSRIRNVSNLVIGDIFHGTGGISEMSEDTVSIYLPGCTLAGAYEVLRHTFSILKENGGKAVIIVKDKNINRLKYSPFEMRFFHPITFKRLKLRNGKAAVRFPVLFAPFKSFDYICGRTKTGEHRKYYDCEMDRFCSERGMELKIVVR